ncbi:YhcB family protein [Agarilytica rhodophyticola]|uniref:YhcB family protein n=1 Tax=Agarilytica rhodophyticola TaxID=1737490 RepID=UPI001FEA7166|nr:YhcB family protein [Agarilytica rhodophyticola]
MTFSLETLLMVSAIVFCIGGLIGAVISRTLMPPEMQKDLEQSLQASRSELERYQQDVSQHFADTSKLVTNLTNAYKEVHDHLAKGAIQLTNAEISKKILDAGDRNLGIEAQDSIEELNFEPPKDWAPKVPGQAGTLSEEFGLDDVREEDNIESLTAGNRG